jgi:hypothetical protein
MTLVRVNPESVRTYGVHAQAMFDDMTASLDRLARDVVGVRYFGPSAVAFKTECGRLAVDFGRRLHVDMSAMAEAVRRSTSNIVASLGGAPISISVSNRPISPPPPQVVEYVDVDTDALEAMIPVTAGHFGSIRNGLSRNFGQLQQTDWEGNAKLAAVDAVGGFTTSARQCCDQAEHALTSHIRRQIESVLTADR